MESVVYVNRYIEFCLLCVEKYSDQFTELELESVKNKCDAISKRCDIVIRRRNGAS
jgi:hypothetical protein